MKRYGAFIIVDKNIDANASSEEMQQPRSPIDDCVNAIVKLCDEAIPVLPNMKAKEQARYAYFNKESCATVKAYALLYAASPLFNGNTQLKDFVNKNGVRLFPEYDKEKWHKAAIAADEALEYAQAGGKHLYNSVNDKGTDMLNTIFNIQSSVLTKTIRILKLYKNLSNNMVGIMSITSHIPRILYPASTTEIAEVAWHQESIW